MLEDRKRLKEKFENKGYKFTVQRREILDVFKDNRGKHLKVEDIYGYVKDRGYKIGVATIYRTLNLLDKMGIINKLEVEDEPVRYEYAGNIEKGKQYHLICLKCNSIIDMDEGMFLEMEKEIQKNYNFKIEDAVLNFYGICDNCKKKF